MFAIFSYFWSKNRLWVHVRTAEAVLTSIHNLYFVKKTLLCNYNLDVLDVLYPSITQFCYMKVGFEGVHITRTCFRDGV